MTPSPFEIAQAVSSNISGAFEQQRDMSSIDRILGEANRQGTPGAVDNAMAQILSRVSPQNQERAIALLQGKQKQFQLQQEQINKQAREDAKRDEQRRYEREKLEEQRKFDETKPGKQTAGEKKTEQLAATRIDNAKQNLILANQGLEQLDRIQELNKDLKGPLAYIKIATGQSPEASEIDAVGTTVIAPILKTFNPVGPIAMSKIQLIMDKHSPKSTDTRSTINGKVNALRNFIQLAKDTNEQYIALMDEYDGDPPLELLNNIGSNAEKSAMHIDKAANEMKKSEEVWRPKPLGKSEEKPSNEKRPLTSFKR